MKSTIHRIPKHLSCSSMRMVNRIKRRKPNYYNQFVKSKSKLKQTEMRVDALCFFSIQWHRRSRCSSLVFHFPFLFCGSTNHIWFLLWPIPIKTKLQNNFIPTFPFQVRIIHAYKMINKIFIRRSKYTKYICRKLKTIKTWKS